MPSPATPARTELWTFRLLCLLGGLSIPLYGYLRPPSDLAVTDPLWLRGVIGALPLAVVVASFLSDAVRREIVGLVYVILYVLIGWFAVIVQLNGLTPEYALGAMSLLIMVGVLAGAGFERIEPLAAVLGVTVAAMGAVTVTSGPSDVDSTLFLAALLASATLLLTGSWLRMAIRQQLASSERRYRAIFERVGDGVLLLEEDSLRVLTVNDAYLRMTGFDRQQLRNRTLYDLTKARADEVNRDVRRALEEQADLGERTHRRSEGSDLPLHLGIVPLRENGRTLLCVTARDLTEEKRIRGEIEAARDQAQSMLELRTAFLNNMSHELRTPLVAINGFLDLLQEDDDLLDVEERAEMLGSLRRSADRLTNTLNAVLDLAQIEGGRYNMEPEPIDVNAATEDAVRLILPLAEAKNLHVRFEPGAPVRAMLDAGSLQRVLLSVLSNAVKFTRAGFITVTLEADSHRVIVYVRDTGIGIEPSELPRLFVPFQQASLGMSREAEGSGLGLSLAKRIIDLMGGRIRIESSPGEGTLVTLVFARTWATPHRTSTPVDEGAACPPTVAPLAPRPRALVVEDHSDTARLMGRMLREAFDVDIAADAEEALRLARSAWYDVLLVDIHLGPGMNGLGLLKQLRSQSAYALVPAVAVTTYDAPGERQRFLGAGFDAYLAKPFTRKQLIEAAEHAHATRTLVAA